MKIQTTLSSFALALACFGGVTTAVAAAADAPPTHAGDVSTTSPTTVVLKEKDVRFINEAASGGMFETEASRLAIERSGDPKIKDFAQHMVDDHTKNAAMLKDVASKKGVAVPTALASREQKMLDDLKAEKTGKAFDKAYCNAMLSSHKDAVGKYAGAKDDVADTDLRAYAAASLPTLQHHTDMAKALNEGKS